MCDNRDRATIARFVAILIHLTLLFFFCLLQKDLFEGRRVSGADLHRFLPFYGNLSDFLALKKVHFFWKMVWIIFFQFPGIRNNNNNNRRFARLHLRRIKLANILSEWLRNPKGEGVNIQTISRVSRPLAPPETYDFGARLGNRSVFILDPRSVFLFRPIVY